MAGIVTAAAVSAIVLVAVTPAYRVLADEANLIGVSKNLFFHRTANFAVTGKWWLQNYWNLDEVADRRPALFPFLVSLLHLVRGYRAENAFYLNGIVFVFFVFCSYRLAKTLGGEVFGVAAAILVAVSPSTVVSARSAGFDFFATFLLLVIVLSFYDYVKAPSPRGLAILTLNLCLLAHVRYEGGGLLVVAAIVLLGFRLVRWSYLRDFGFVYSLVPVFLLPRYWQAVAKANDSEQPLSTKLFGFGHFVHNSGEYLSLALRPLGVGDAHPPLLVILGTLGWILIVVHLLREAVRKRLAPRHLHLGVFIAFLFATEALLCFSYFEGEPMQAASARLFIWLDTFMAFAAAWLLAMVASRLASRPTAESPRAWGGMPLAVIASAALLAMHLPAAVEARFINALILTRQAAQEVALFRKRGRPANLFDLDRPSGSLLDRWITARSTSRRPMPIAALSLSCHAISIIDVYLIQDIDLSTGKPQPGYGFGRTSKRRSMVEFQTTDTASTRIARVRKESAFRLFG